MRKISRERSQILDERLVSNLKSKFLILCAIAAFVALLCPALASATPIDLGTAESFAVLAGSTVTNTGPTTITGDVGLYPGSEITGMGSITLHGDYHINDSTAITAKTDLTTAYTNLAGMTPGTTLSGTLGPQTLYAGVYNFTGGAALLTGALILDAQGNPNAQFVFQMASTLTTASSSSVNVINGGSSNEVYWVVGSSATLGTGTAFEGNILADQSITLTTGATILNGRALARIGAVTMDTDVIAIPIPATMLLLGSGLAGLVAFRKRFKKA